MRLKRVFLCVFLLLGTAQCGRTVRMASTGNITPRSPEYSAFLLSYFDITELSTNSTDTAGNAPPASTVAQSTFLSELRTAGFSNLFMDVITVGDGSAPQAGWEGQYIFNGYSLTSLSCQDRTIASNPLSAFSSAALSQSITPIGNLQTLSHASDELSAQNTAGSTSDVSSSATAVTSTSGMSGAMVEGRPATWSSIYSGIGFSKQLQVLMRDTLWDLDSGTSFLNVLSYARRLWVEDYTLDEISRNCGLLGAALGAGQDPGTVVPMMDLGGRNNFTAGEGLSSAANIFLFRAEQGIKNFGLYGSYFTITGGDSIFQGISLPLTSRISTAVANPFAGSSGQRTLNVVVDFSTSTMSDSWNALDASNSTWAAICNAAGAAGYIVTVTTSPSSNASAYWIMASGQTSGGVDVDLSSSALAALQSTKPAVLQVFKGLPTTTNWLAARSTLGLPAGALSLNSSATTLGNVLPATVTIASASVNFRDAGLTDSTKAFSVSLTSAGTATSLATGTINATSTIMVTYTGTTAARKVFVNGTSLHEDMAASMSQMINPTTYMTTVGDAAVFSNSNGIAILGNSSSPITLKNPFSTVGARTIYRRTSAGAETTSTISPASNVFTVTVSAGEVVLIY